MDYRHSTHWKTKEGVWLTPGQMDHQHRRNTLNFAVRVARRWLYEDGMNTLAYACTTNGEMASYYAEGAASSQLARSCDPEACWEFALEAYPVLAQIKVLVVAEEPWSPTDAF